MERIDYSKLLSRICGRIGVPATELGVDEAQIILDSINGRLMEAWEASEWRDLVRCEERFFRPVYDDGTAYATGAEVYWEERYYRALGATTGHEPSDEMYWEAFTPSPRVVGWEQAGQTAIGAVLGVTDANPAETTRLQRVAHCETADGIVVLAPCALSVWLRYRVRCPELSGALWSATATYAAGAQVYWVDAAGAGNFYDVLTTTAAAQSPGTHADKYRLVEIPRRMAGFLCEAAVADWLVADGQSDKASATEVKAYQKLELAVTPARDNRMEVEA